MSEKIKKIAVLIDGENVDPSYADRVFSCAASLGTVAVREIYGSGIALNDWAEPILKHTIRTNFTLRPNKYKNSSDIALVIGAMEIFMGGLSDPEKACGCFVIASSDSDFSPLAVRLRREGIDVVGMGEPGTPYGAPHHSPQFRTNDAILKTCAATVVGTAIKMMEAKK